MRIVTWNINGVRARQGVLLNWLEKNSPDIVALQEIKIVDEEFPRLEIEALGYNVETFGQKSWNGVALLSKKRFDEVHRGLPGDDADEQSRLIEGVFSTESGVVRVCCIYLPNGNPVKSEKFPYKLGWMDRLIPFVESRLALEEPFILLGDFNIIPANVDATFPEKWVNDALFRPESLQRFRTLVNLGLTDAVRAVTAEPSHTFWDFKTFGWERKEGIRIDHLLLSPQLADRLEGITVHAEVRGGERPSDHVPVEGRFAI
ncbi:MAG TPA: exodeoxyribonuclease III [Devosia sp.]|nr:exodeoxyribonuclease III [Devosia sp.]